MHLINRSFTVLWFFLPMFVANMAPVIAMRLPLLRHWSYPLDHRRFWNHRRLLGKNKTYRGLIAGVIAGIATVWIRRQFSILLPLLADLAVFDYHRADWWVLGWCLGFGALMGDAIESFVKRQLDIKPGQPFQPWDQLDQFFGAVVWLALFFWPPVWILIGGGLLTFGGVIVVNYLAFKVGLKTVPH
jgi:CDP-2,3-bis-(O-geranylgeranyl)-sn-glycerol synthase